MAKPKDSAQSGESPRGRKRRQPYDHIKDLQSVGDRSSDRSFVEAPHIDRILDVENRYTRDENGNTSLLMKLAMGGDFNPMKIAAVLVGTGIFFAFVGTVMVFHDDPAWAFAALFLAFQQGMTAGGLAFHESHTRRVEAKADIEAFKAENAEAATIILPSSPTPATFDIKTETLLRQPVVEEPPTPRALDGGEPTH